jgi:hypothetical protein
MLETTVFKEEFNAKMDSTVMEIFVHQKEPNMMENDASTLLCAVETFVKTECVKKEEQFLVTLILNALDFLKFVTRLEEFVECAHKVFVEVKSNMQCAKEIPFKQSLLQNL